jgi:hypothetical protein
MSDEGLNRPPGDRIDDSGAWTPPQVVTTARPSETSGMLPGIAAICMFLVFMTMLNVYAALHGAFGEGMGKVGVLALATLLAIGLFGMLRLKKWGWALVTAGCLLVSAGDFYFYGKAHIAFFLLRGGFVLVFFLYLVRPETRARLR